MKDARFGMLLLRENPVCVMIHAAGEKGLLADVEAWFGYRRMRDITAHTYDHVKARQVYEGSLLFVEDARALLGALESRHA